MAKRIIWSLGIDPSLTGTGIVQIRGDDPRAMWVDGAYDVVLSECISTPAKTPLLSRCETIVSVIEGILAAAPSSMHITIEDWTTSRFSVLQLVPLQTLVRHAIWKQGREFKLLTPTALKNVATGDGGAKKKAMKLAAAQRFGFETKNDNLADAFLLSMLGATTGHDIVPSQKHAVSLLRSW